MCCLTDLTSFARMHHWNHIYYSLYKGTFIKEKSTLFFFCPSWKKKKGLNIHQKHSTYLKGFFVRTLTVSKGKFLRKRNLQLNIVKKAKNTCRKKNVKSNFERHRLHKELSAISCCVCDCWGSFCFLFLVKISISYFFILCTIHQL